MTTLLAALVDASNTAAQTTSRRAKRDAIAACLRAASPDEVEIAVAYLSGEIRQGRIGIGYATLASQRGTPAAEPVLSLLDVDAALGQLAAHRAVSGTPPCATAGRCQSDCSCESSPSRRTSIPRRGNRAAWRHVNWCCR